MLSLTEKRKRAALYSRKWRKQNADKARELKRLWRAKNPDKAQQEWLRYYAANKQKAIERAQRWRKANPEKAKQQAREKHLKRAYGLTAEAVSAMLAGQGGVCAVCGTPDGDWVVDHNHISGDVRGILCRQCNAGLGCFKDNPKSMLNAVNYLARV